MIKFWTISSLFFGIAVGTAFILLSVLLAEEFMDNIERKYGFKACIFAFLSFLAMISVGAAAIMCCFL